LIEQFPVHGTRAHTHASTRATPDFRKAFAAACKVAPVVITSSTRTT
jgi:hypothetical protein